MRLLENDFHLGEASDDFRQHAYAFGVLSRALSSFLASSFELSPVPSLPRTCSRREEGKGQIPRIPERSIADKKAAGG